MFVGGLQHCSSAVFTISVILLPPTKEEVHIFARVRLCVCLSVCLLARSLLKTRAWIQMKRCVSHRCRDMDELINF